MADKPKCVGLAATAQLGEDDALGGVLMHATGVVVGERGIVLCGPPGSGKSDLALRMIMRSPGAICQNAPRLICDDYVRLKLVQNEGCSSVSVEPGGDAIKGLLEVRGVGLVPVPFTEMADLSLVVELVGPETEIERLPDDASTTVCVFGQPVRRLHIRPFEASAVDRILIAISQSNVS